MSVQAFAQPPVYSISTFDVPGAQFTFARGINVSGEICGIYLNEPRGFSQAFIRDRSGAFTFFSPPGALITLAFGINDLGQVAGQWSPSSDGSFQHAFVRNPDGSFTMFDAPDSDVTGAYGINRAGQTVVNALREPGPYRAFLRDPNGSYTPISVAGSAETSAEGLSNNGFVVGYASTSYAANESFYAMRNLGLFTFSEPFGTGVTTAYGINDASVIVGSFNSGYGYDQVTHGFIREADGSFASFDAPGATATVLYGIDDAGEIVGSFSDAGGSHGLVATPCREARLPGSLAGTAVILPAGSCGGVDRRRLR